MFWRIQTNDPPLKKAVFYRDMPKRQKRTRKLRRQRGGGEFLFVSGNEGKIRELTALLSPHRVISHDIDLPEIQTTDVAEVVRDKVLTAWKALGKPLFVEDTGLYITSPPMNGFPGALIKFYYKKLGSAGICQKNGGERAFAESVIGYHDGTTVHIFKGVVEGVIATTPQPGPHGFGWDDIFVPTENNPTGKSFAQLPTELKNAISMRKRAAEAFREMALGE
jgi:XTP/dITP diphosphohydrolase